MVKIMSSKHPPKDPMRDLHEQEEMQDASSRMLDEGDPNLGANGDAAKLKALSELSREELESAFLESEKKSATYYTQALQAAADLENIRKRTEREVLQARLYGQERLIESLVPVIDSLDQALMVINAEKHPELAEGVELTLKLFLSALEKQGVVLLDPQGQPFNPKEHEAMSIQVSDEVPPNTVLTVFQKGYKLNDRIIRAARVIVSKAMG